MAHVWTAENAQGNKKGKTVTKCPSFRGKKKKKTMRKLEIRMMSSKNTKLKAVMASDIPTDIKRIPQTIGMFRAISDSSQRKTKMNRDMIERASTVDAHLYADEVQCNVISGVFLIWPSLPLWSNSWIFLDITSRSQTKTVIYTQKLESRHPFQVHIQPQRAFQLKYYAATR